MDVPFLVLWALLELDPDMGDPASDQVSQCADAHVDQQTDMDGWNYWMLIFQGFFEWDP